MPNFNNLTTIFSSIGSIYQMSQGVAMQTKAAKKIGAGYRAEAAATGPLATYNIALDELDLGREIDAVARNAAQTVGIQQAQMAANGFDIASGSNLSIVNAGLDAATRQIVQARNNQKILADQRRYLAQKESIDFENKARAVEYQAKVAASQSKSKLFDYVSPLLNQIGSLF